MVDQTNQDPPQKETPPPGAIPSAKPTREPPLIDAKPVRSGPQTLGRPNRTKVVIAFMFLAGVILAACIAWAAREFGAPYKRLLALEQQSANSEHLLAEQARTINTLSEQIKVLSKPVDVDTLIMPLDKRLGASENQIDNFRQALAELAQKQPHVTDLSPLTQRADALEMRFDILAKQQTADANAFAKLELAMSGFQPRFATLDAGVAVLGQKMHDFDMHLTSFENRISPLEAALSATRNQAQATQQKLEAVEAAPNAAAIAIAAIQLARQVRQGGMLTNAFATLDALKINDPVLTKLHSLASNGVMSPSDLQTAYAAARPNLVAILAPPAAAPVADNWFGEVAGKAGKLVEVRDSNTRTTNVQANDLLKDVDQAMTHGDFTAAALRLSALPAPAQTIAADLVAKIRTREEAIADASAFQDSCMKALAGRR